MENKYIQPKIDNSVYSHYIGIKFTNSSRAYFFGYKDFDLQLDDKVVVETARGTELGFVATRPFDIANYSSDFGLKPILRKATDIDIKCHDINLKDAAFAIEICKAEVEKLKLDMLLVSCEYTLDKSKVIFSYVADARVDFRELLKVLAVKLHTRIELRQIGPRDKSKLVGGIGSCGLTLCCSTFLNEFDGISIQRAKNQMLAINIPKLSGHCGKLICCLKYEDDAYLEARQHFPELGTKVMIDKVEYTVTNINVISNVIKVENPEDVKFLPRKEFIEQTNWRKKTDNNGKPNSNNNNKPKVNPVNNNNNNVNNNPNNKNNNNSNNRKFKNEKK